LLLVFLAMTVLDMEEQDKEWDKVDKE